MVKLLLDILSAPTQSSRSFNIFAYLYMFRRFATVFIALGKYKKDEIPADISGRRPSFVPKILAGFITIGLNVYLLISIYYS